MSNENKKNLLNDDELEKIGGGLTYTITSVDIGDVFLNKNNSNEAFVVMADTPIVDNNTEVPIVDAVMTESGWKKGGYVRYKSLSWILTVATYSPELTRKI